LFASSLSPVEVQTQTIEQTVLTVEEKRRIAEQKARQKKKRALNNVRALIAKYIPNFQGGGQADYINAMIAHCESVLSSNVQVHLLKDFVQGSPFRE